MTNWRAPQKPIDYAEEALVTAILDGGYPAGELLPGERDLATQLGVTRPTLREALRRLESDGWVTIQQGKPTRVNDFWREGGPNILTAIVRYERPLPPGFVIHLLEVRQALAPLYTRAAVAHNPAGVAAFLAQWHDLSDTPEAYATFDWQAHHTLTILSRNPVYTLILNGFAGFYEHMAQLYFALEEARVVSRRYYTALEAAAQQADPAAAEEASRTAMAQSLRFWQALEATVAAQQDGQA